jgi:hypothetical protein
MILTHITKFVTNVYGDTDIHNMLQDNIRDWEWDEEQYF